MLAEPDARRAPAKVVVAGGGVAALEALVALTSLVPGALEKIVIAPNEHFSYRPLQVGEPFGLGQGRRYGLAKLCKALGAKFVCGEVVSVDGDRHAVTLRGGEQVHYDVLLLAAGGHAFPAFEHGVTFDRETAPGDFDEVLSATGGGFAAQLAIVVPDGATWTLPAYELAMLTAGFFPRSKVTLVTYEESPLEVFGTTVSCAVAEIFAHAGITLRCGRRPEVATPTALRFGWEWLEASRIVSLPLLTGPAIGGTPADARGFLPVDEHGRVTGLQDVYAAGDGTTVPVKQGGLAAQMADAAALHIAACLGENVPAKPFTPVLRGLLLTPGGPRYLRTELADRERTSAISAEPLWWPPSKIASRWLAPYLARVDSESEAGLVAAGA